MHISCYNVIVGEECVIYIMAIKYDKLFALLKERKITTYRIRQDNIIGQATLTKLKKGQGGLDHRSIDKLCKVLQCQPGDIMEYVPDDEENNED